MGMSGVVRKRSKMVAGEVPYLVEICLRTTFFQFQDTFYEQLDGAAIGSPLSPIVANLYMEHLEETALRTAPDPPRLWLRYVDNTFVIWPHGQEKLDCFYEHVNTQHRNIKFTVEHEREYKLAFLDVQVTRTNNRLTTSVYRKPTHTDHYIPFHSHHHQRTVTGVLLISFLASSPRTSPPVKHTRPLVAVLKSSHSCSFFSFVADEDLRSRNVLLLTFFLAT